MTDVVNHPAHYTQSRFTCECIAITRHMTFCAGNAFKYIWRHREKNGVEDLRKAAVYLKWALEDRRISVLPDAAWIVSELIEDHVAGPLRALPNAPAVYQALELIAVSDDYESALLLVEQAIAEYECAPIVLPADQFDKLMAEGDQADPAPKLAEAAVKPRAFRRSDLECSGNSPIPRDTESGNFPNIGER
ncbi:DUF3310 domain-containing protein [Nocardia thailandica]|uniref:DUF3310 domain-containing protein n=1 Tax=Nocardia thailandica TaxID=257275 RepID=UPI0002DEE1B8|nr:DUF3310 domain-containing protein [Nocardia thailandica]